MYEINMSDNNNKSVLVLDLKIDSPKALLCSLSTSALTTRMFVVRMSDSWISHRVSGFSVLHI